MKRDVFVYKLVVELPEGAGVPGEYWEPENWGDWCEEHDHWEIEAETGASFAPQFRWPTPRNFLSRTAAERRAMWMREFGATVTVERSLPVVWS